MSLNRHNPRRDAVERDVIQALEAHGWIVSRLSGAGVPDLVIWRRANNVLFDPIIFVEVKSKTGKPTKAQRTWQGPPPVTLRSADEALTWLRSL